MCNVRCGLTRRPGFAGLVALFAGSCGRTTCGAHAQTSDEFTIRFDTIGSWFEGSLHVRHREPIGDLRCPGKLLDESLQSGHRYSPFTPTAESIFNPGSRRGIAGQWRRRSSFPQQRR